MQLDIFDDSRDVMLRNDVLSALQHYDVPGARQALRALADEYPDDGSLAQFDTLVDTLENRSTTAFSSHDAVLEARTALLIHVHPAALQLLGGRIGATWLQPLWQELAQRATGLPFRAAHADAHPASLYLLAGRWQEAHEAVNGIESWRRIPAPLMCMAEACYRLNGLNGTDGAASAWPLFAELACLAPARFDSLLRHLDDSALNGLRRSFDATFDGSGEISDLAWFPAWVLTQKSGLASLLKQAQTSREAPPGRALRLMTALLTLEREGRHHELLEGRRTLQALNGALHAAYMKTR